MLYLGNAGCPILTQAMSKVVAAFGANIMTTDYIMKVSFFLYLHKEKEKEFSIYIFYLHILRLVFINFFLL